MILLEILLSDEVENSIVDDLQFTVDFGEHLGEIVRPEEVFEQAIVYYRSLMILTWRGLWI